MRLLAALAAFLVVGVPGAAGAAPSRTVDPLDVVDPAAEPPRSRIGATGAAIIAAGALTLWGASAIEQATDDVTGCRWCEPGGFDRWARDELRWRDTRAAGRASDVLLLGVPLGSAVVAAWLAGRDGARVEILEDLSLIAAAIAVTDPLTTGVKHSVGRLRPEAWMMGGPRVEGDLHSFFSGHTSRVFAAAAALAQVSRLRGRSGWKWIAAAAFTAAAATGWLRVAADQHWATDVLGGAVVGTAVGWAVPSGALRSVKGRPRRAMLVPAPGGLAVVF